MSEKLLHECQSWAVHKFGGTSVGSADCMRSCIDIIKPLLSKQRIAVVVSAMGGKPKVTDLLLDTVHAAAAGRNNEITEKLDLIHAKHKTCVNDILCNAPDIAERILNNIQTDLKDISDLLRAVSLMRNAHEQILELVSGYGEVWSATIMAEAMRQNGLPFVFLNARDVLFVSEDELGTKVHWDISEQKLGEYITRAELDFKNTDFPRKFDSLCEDVPSPHLMITGYIASNVNGVATTLKRDGSDFSASIFGKMLKATGITIWTDVSGVYSADPRRVPEAQIIPEVSYTEAIELAYFGAKVIHPKTMAPAIIAQIPIYIRNTFAPADKGTRIFLPSFSKGLLTRERTVCGFTTVDNIALLNVEGSGMIGVPGIAHRLFGALKNANISVMFIAQASSEHSICFATRDSYADIAKTSIEEAFFYELKQGSITDVRVIRNCAIIAAVGESMSNMPGVSGIFFGALGEASINILSISQGCDERNISAVVYAKDATRALRAVHSAFWLSALGISIGIVGTGRVGSALLQTLIEQLELLNDRFGLNIKIRAVANSSKMLLGDDLSTQLKGKLKIFSKNSSSKGLQESDGGFKQRSHSNFSLEDLGAVMAEEGDEKVPLDLDAFYDHVNAGVTPHAIIIDATTSSAIASLHPQWLLGGMHIVTANKRAISSSLASYNSVHSAARARNKMYMSEVTIGAALPIRTTLNDLLCSGDEVHSIVGLMSVSLGVVLTEICDNGLTFTEALKRTFATGLFEDDAFADLEGTEVAQKLLILARELGVPMEIEDIDLEPLATRRFVRSWAEITDEFAAEDEIMRRRAEDARSKGCVLRYVQRIRCDPCSSMTSKGTNPVKATASIRLEEVPIDSPQAMVKGPIYHFAFHTARYAQNPLVIQGPLSDSANTASGIIGDILRIAKSIGAKDKGPEEFQLTRDSIAK